MNNEIIKELEAIYKDIDDRREEIYMHNHKQFDEIQKRISALKHAIEHEISEMMNNLELEQSKYGERETHNHESLSSEV